MKKWKIGYGKVESVSDEAGISTTENATGTPAADQASQVQILPTLLDLISISALLRETGDQHPDWIAAARVSIAYGGLHLQLCSSRRVEKEDLLELQGLLRAALDYPLAVRIVFRDPQSAAVLQEKIVVITPLKNGKTSPIMNHDSHGGALQDFYTDDETFSGSSGDRKRKKNYLNQLKFRGELERTLPAGARLWKVSFYQMQRGEGALQFVVLRMYVPEDQQKEVQSWRDELERRYRVGILIQAERVSEGITRQLTYVSDDDGIVRDPERVGRLVTDIYGPPPAVQVLQRARSEPGAALEDLREYPFITIDPTGARDLDDALWAERLPGGRFRLLVAFADVTEAVLPGSSMDAYARKVCFSLYGRFSSIPLLGEEFGFKELSLLPGQERLCWTVELEIDREGRLLGSRFFRALAKSEAQLSFEQVESLENIRPDLVGIVRTLRQATFILRQKRLSRAGFIKFKSEGDSYIIVEECMLAAKAVIARTFWEAGVPILYKVHAPPGKFLRKRFIREIKAVGIKARKKDFTDPLRFRGILSHLQQKGEMKLFHRILDAYLKRARYDIENRGHHGLGLDAYTEIKGLRNYAGLLNQRQAAYLLCGDQGLSEREIGRYQYHINRKHRIYYDNSIRLITFESLREKLTMVGQLFHGEISQVLPEGVLINVPGFYCEGLVPVRNQEELAVIKSKWPVGSAVSVELVGYDPLCKRYLFSF